ncbi:MULTISPECIES: hypothetical protein [Clostridium]|uniref:Uncharacterized protein n=1 Tax=Clostridium ragsdalei P11 TaxID=1353534 RepID=A0A1A6AUL1_9CLOT|nr:MULTISPECIES: hypothetical protein [Clostridium]OBR93737.1 hypothetical protein CLRAG_18740 [Clostridium ragsdalei P11]QXE19919.1 hypothetical protein B5S50_14430 [Clostridium sp. 001]
MIINSEKSFFQKIKTFDKVMIETIKTNKDIFEFEDEQYAIYSNGVFVQTLINDRILYRIFIDECRNDASVHYDLFKCLHN